MNYVSHDVPTAHEVPCQSSLKSCLLNKFLAFSLERSAMKMEHLMDPPGHLTSEDAAAEAFQNFLFSVPCSGVWLLHTAEVGGNQSAWTTSLQEPKHACCCLETITLRSRHWRSRRSSPTLVAELPISSMSTVSTTPRITYGQPNLTESRVQTLHSRAQILRKKLRRHRVSHSLGAHNWEAPHSLAGARNHSCQEAVHN